MGSEISGCEAVNVGASALPRAFRTVTDGTQITYADGGIRYAAANQWVPLPAPDEAKIGSMIWFYGAVNQYGYSCGFYTNGSSYIKHPDGNVTDYFSVGSGGEVAVQLDSDGLWQVTVVQEGVYWLPGLANDTITLDRVEGANWYVGYIDGAVTFEAANGLDADEIQCSIGYAASSTPTLTLGNSIKLPADLSAFMPISLDYWRSYAFRLLKRGGYWTLNGTIQGPTTEGED